MKRRGFVKLAMAAAATPGLAFQEPPRPADSPTPRPSDSPSPEPRPSEPPPVPLGNAESVVADAATLASAAVGGLSGCTVWVGHCWPGAAVVQRS